MSLPQDTIQEEEAAHSLSQMKGPSLEALAALDLEAMTSEAVELFRSGQKQEALDLAAAFSTMAELHLGRTHPVFINSLATVAAFAEQMGHADEATALLEEAEDLHEELEMEVLEQRLDEELLQSEASKVQERESSEFAKGSIISAADAFLTGVDPGETSSANEDELFDSADDSDRSSEEDVDASELELEAELITRLSSEVSKHIEAGCPDQAADLLREAEQLLTSGSGNSIRGVTCAALHTLWAIVLENVGEKEKAQVLFDEALSCLKQEAEELRSGFEDNDDLDEDKDSSELEQTLEDSEKYQRIPDKAEDLVETKEEGSTADKVHTNAARGEREAVKEQPRMPEPLTVVSLLQASPPAIAKADAAAAAPSKSPQKRPVPLAPQAKGKIHDTKSDAKPVPKAEGVVRVGGGFSIPVPPPKASQKKIASTTRKPKAKASKTLAGSDCIEESPEKGLTPEETYRREVSKSMVTADHFLGLLKFERAADELEEQLAKLSEESCVLRNSDLHIEVLLKYAGILSWDGDSEGSLDAFTAADEVLADRQATLQGDSPSIACDLKRRRANIWTQQAQVYRAEGNLDMAEKRLTEAIACLTEMNEVDTTCQDVSDALKDSQAALGQICVQKRDFVRAEQLYLAAFAVDQGADNDQIPDKTETF